MENGKSILMEKTVNFLSSDFKTVLLILAAFLTISSVSTANTIVQKSFNNEIPNFFKILTFDKFNENDTLSSIRISLNLQINGGSIIIDNDADSSASGTFEFGENAQLGSTDVSLTGGPGKTRAYNFLPVSLASNVDDGDGDYSPLSPDGSEYNGSIVSDQQSGFIDNSIWSQYQGSGTFDIQVSVWLQTNYIGTGKVEYFSNMPPNINGFVEVVYTSVPEPATIVLLMVGTLVFMKKKIR